MSILLVDIGSVHMKSCAVCSTVLLGILYGIDYLDCTVYSVAAGSGQKKWVYCVARLKVERDNSKTGLPVQS